MDFIDEVRTRSDRFSKRIEHLETEEATKSSLVLPFLQMLGYEIFDRGIFKKCVNSQAVYPLSEQHGLEAQERR